MQAKKTLVLGLLALAAVPLSAKDDNDPSNCRLWNKLDNTAQIWYLQGFSDGLLKGATRTSYDISGDTTATEARATKIATRFIGPNTLGEMREGVTAICKLPENSLIGIGETLELFTMKLRGEPPSEIDAYLARLRRYEIQLHESGKTNK